MSAPATLPRAPFPWAAAMGAGLGLLRLPAGEFWRMTPRELAAALAALLPQPAAGLARGELAALMARFPDHPRPEAVP